MITAEATDIFEEKINACIKGKNINDFTIKFQSMESYPDEASADEPERFFNALIIFKDDIKKEHKPNHKQPYNKNGRRYDN